jgi:hypothetical protein
MWDAALCSIPFLDSLFCLEHATTNYCVPSDYVAVDKLRVQIINNMYRLLSISDLLQQLGWPFV